MWDTITPHLRERKVWIQETRERVAVYQCVCGGFVRIDADWEEKELFARDHLLHTPQKTKSIHSEHTEETNQSDQRALQQVLQNQPQAKAGVRIPKRTFPLTKQRRGE